MLVEKETIYNVSSYLHQFRLETSYGQSVNAMVYPLVQVSVTNSQIFVWTFPSLSHTSGASKGQLNLMHFSKLNFETCLNLLYPRWWKQSKRKVFSQSSIWKPERLKDVPPNLSLLNVLINEVLINVSIFLNNISRSFI